MVRIAELNSITKAAKASFMSLPTASGRIKHLEESIGGQLMLRVSRGVTLTPLGQAFVHHSRLTLSQLNQMDVTLKDIKGGIKKLRLAVFMSAFEFLPEELLLFAKKHPNFSIDLRERLSADVVRLVTEGHADIGIIAGFVRTEGLESFPYHRQRLTVVVPSSHPLRRNSGIEFLETLQFEHVGLREGSATQIFLRQIVDDARLPFRSSVQVGNFETVCRLIAAEMGVGIMPETTARRYAKTMAIRLLPLTDDWAVRDMRVCVRKLSLLPDYGQQLVKFLVDSATKARKRVK